MLHVKIKLIPPLDKEVGSRELDIHIKDNSKIRDILYNLALKYRINLIINGNVNPGYIILLNDKDINILEGLETRLRSGDVITIIPVSHGG